MFRLRQKIDAIKSGSAVSSAAISNSLGPAGKSIATLNLVASCFAAVTY